MPAQCEDHFQSGTHNIKTTFSPVHNLLIWLSARCTLYWYHFVLAHIYFYNTRITLLHTIQLPVWYTQPYRYCYYTNIYNNHTRIIFCIHTEISIALTHLLIFQLLISSKPNNNKQETSNVLTITFLLVQHVCEKSQRNDRQAVWWERNDGGGLPCHLPVGCSRASCRYDHTRAERQYLDVQFKIHRYGMQLGLP